MAIEEASCDLSGSSTAVLNGFRVSVNAANSTIQCAATTSISQLRQRKGSQQATGTASVSLQSIPNRYAATNFLGAAQLNWLVGFRQPTGTALLVGAASIASLANMVEAARLTISGEMTSTFRGTFLGWHLSQKPVNLTWQDKATGAPAKF